MNPSKVGLAKFKGLTDEEIEKSSFAESKPVLGLGFITVTWNGLLSPSDNWGLILKSNSTAIKPAIPSYPSPDSKAPIASWD